MDMCALLCLEWVTDKDLLYSTGSSAQCSVAGSREGGLGENACMSVYG